MESGGGSNQQPGGTSTQFLDQWIPLTPSKPNQPTMNCAQSPMAAPGERIDGSNACHAYNATRRNVGLMNVLSSMVGMGQTIPYLELSQSTSAQLGSNSNISYLSGLNPQMIGFNQLMYMANPRILDSDLTGRTIFCNDSFHLSPTMHTDADIQTPRHNNNPVSQLAPATPDLRAKKIQKILTTDPANLHMDGQVNHNENNVNDLFHSPCESHIAISQDQYYQFNQKNVFLPQQGCSNLESSSTIYQPSILTASPTFIQPVTPLKEPHDHEGKEVCQGNDLNETPPQKLKRKKHRPKVVREAKPKKTQNPVTPQQPVREKRKYVRKSTLKGLTTTPSDCGASSELPVRKKASCRRALNFNLPDYQSHDSIVNGGSCTSAVDNQSDPQLKGRCRSTNNRGGTSNKQADLQSKPGGGIVDEDTANGVGIDLNCSFVPTMKDFQPENSTPFNVIVRTEPSQASMKVLARRKNMEQVTKQITNKESGSTILPMSENGNLHALETQTKSLQNLSTDSNNAQKRLKRGFYETITTAEVNRPDTMENHAHNPTTSKKPKPFLIQKGNTHNAPFAGSMAGSNNYNSQLQNRTIEAQDEHNGGISDFVCNGVSLSSNCQQKCTSIQGVFSSMKFAQSMGSNNIPAHCAHPPRIANEVISCRSSYDELDERLKSLNINETSKVDAEKNKQIVLYGGDKQIVSYERSVDSIKKKIKPRAKVVLDGETLRVWDMLMWKQGGDTTEKVDSTKEKWWAEERRIFKGRVDSFIARMHLVQGDRRFSKWKGSVLDSVVGVFLTQNVSDHLSSSAFMALAAKFPMHPSSRRNHMDLREETSRSSVGSKWQMTASKQGMSNEHLETSFQENFIIEKEVRSNLGSGSSCVPGTLERNSEKTTDENLKINCRSSVDNSSSILSNLNSCNHSTSQMSSGIEVEEVQDMVMSSKLNDVMHAASISFTEHFQILGDVKRTCLDEEAGLSHEKGHEDELYWVGTAQFSTTPDKDEPKVQKDFLNARGLPFVENMTAKNYACQPVCEDVTEVLPVEDVVSSQNSVISSISSTDSYIQLVNDASSNVKYHMKENVVSGSCRSVYDEVNISFSELLQMQEGELLQKLHGNNEAIADPLNKYNNSITHERWGINSDEDMEELSPYKCHRNSYSSCIKEAIKPNWRSSEWRCASEDETRPYLPSSASEVAGVNYVNYTEISHESMHPSSKHAASLPFSTSSCSSINNSWIQNSKDVVQPSSEFEPWIAEGLQHRLDSGPHSEALESMEGFSCVNSLHSVKTSVAKPESPVHVSAGKLVSEKQETQPGPANQELKEKFDFHECTGSVGMEKAAESETFASNSAEKLHCSNKSYGEAIVRSKPETRKSKDERKKDIDWDNLRKEVQLQHQKKQRSCETMDSLDYEALRCADVSEISDAIRERGMNNRLAQRIQELLNRLMQDHGSMDLEWLRDVPPEKAKEYLLSIKGLGLKSVECVRLLTLHHLAFPVDTNVGRIAVRLGWVPLQPLPESLQLHLLELYPILESVQKYLWPRLCMLDQKSLYELHYQLITFGKVFCTKNKPNCNACPLRAECKHFASAFASARLALPGPENKSLVSSSVPLATSCQNDMTTNCMPLPSLASPHLASESSVNKSEPIIEEPPSPEPENVHISQNDIEEAFWENDPEDIPTIKLNIEEFSQSVQNYMLENNVELKDVDMSKALVALSVEAASIPVPKLKSISRLRTEHQVYELPDDHTLLSELDPREADDPCPYLLAIWTPGETANSVEPPEMFCSSQGLGNLCDKVACFTCNSRREVHTQTVRGTLLVPCRTAMRGSFPLNGTYFQVNEVFADHDSSLEPINVPRALIWNLPRRTVYFGTSVPTIFRGLTTESIQQCFWRGFVCVRGFDRKTRAPRPLMARLHLSASKLAKANKEVKKSEQGK